MAVSRLCAIPGCDKRLFERGYCYPHYYRLRKYGDPSGGRPLLPPRRKDCSVAGCGKKHFAFGFCVAHYTRNRRHGDAYAGGTGRGVPLKWLRDHANHDSPDCLTWPFAKGGDGAALVWFDGRQMPAARLVCTWTHGEPVDPSLDSAHDCGKGHEACVNPKHIRWDTRAGNLADMIKHGTKDIGEQHEWSKLTISEVREIRALRGKVGQKEIAARFNVCKGTVSSVQLRKNWAWLD